MIKCEGNRAFLGDREVLENAVSYIKKFHEKYHSKIVKKHYKIIACMINWDVNEVKGFFWAHGIDIR